jgi:hypothetical protein
MYNAIAVKNKHIIVNVILKKLVCTLRNMFGRLFQIPMYGHFFQIPQSSITKSFLCDADNFSINH